MLPRYSVRSFNKPPNSEIRILDFPNFAPTSHHCTHGAGFLSSPSIYRSRGRPATYFQKLDFKHDANSNPTGHGYPFRLVYPYLSRFNSLLRTNRISHRGELKMRERKTARC